MDPSTLSSVWWLFTITSECDQPPSQKAASPDSWEQDGGTDQLPSLCIKPQAILLPHRTHSALPEHKMLRLSVIQHHSPRQVGGSCKKTQSSQTSFYHPGSLALGVQMLTGPSALGVLSPDKVEHQDWPLTALFPRNHCYRAGLTPWQPAGRGPAPHGTFSQYQPGMQPWSRGRSPRQGKEAVCSRGRVYEKWL